MTRDGRGDDADADPDERRGGYDASTCRRDRRLLERFPDAVEGYALCTLDADGRVVGWNDGAERLYGHAPADVLGEHVATVYPDDERADRLLAAAETTGVGEAEGWQVRADGQRFPARTTVTAVHDDDGVRHGFVHLVRDREASGTDLPVDARLLGDALDAVDDVVYVLDPDGTVRYVNATAVRGHAPTAIESTHAADLLEPSDRGRLVRGLERARETGADERELRLLGADGSVRTYEFDSRTLTDETGEVARIVGVGRDVSDRADRERALSELHRATRALMRADGRERIAELTTGALVEILTLTHAAVHFHDPQGEALVPVSWTGAVEEIIGEPPALGPGSRAWDAYRADESAYFDDLREVDGLHNESTPLRSELIVPLADHGVVLVAATEPGAFDANDRRLTRLLCENVTAALERVDREETLRERERELERENERLDEFASLVSHDLRNPLNVAEGHLELARAARDGEDCPHVAEATAALERMEAIVDDVLSLAREGTAVEGTERVDLTTLVERCWTHVATDGAELRVVDDLTVRADERRLARLFENLFRNAVEHGCEGARGDDASVVVTVGAVVEGDGDGSGREATRGFYVADDGVGVPPAERASVFDAGYSGDDGGTGFGLPIVRDVAEAHGWTVSLTSSATGGARFEVTGVAVAC
jgi:PAS domain S-box-containing protein